MDLNHARLPIPPHPHVTPIFGGRGWIRTTEVTDDRFTVCSLWPLGNPSKDIGDVDYIIKTHLQSQAFFSKIPIFLQARVLRLVLPCTAPPFHPNASARTFHSLKLMDNANCLHSVHSLPLLLDLIMNIMRPYYFFCNSKHIITMLKGDFLFYGTAE